VDHRLNDVQASVLIEIVRWADLPGGFAVIKKPCGAGVALRLASSTSGSLSLMDNAKPVRLKVGRIR